MRELYNRTLILIDENFYRILLFIVTLVSSFILFIKNIDKDEFDKKEVLSILISIASIIVAIIVTYLFSKLFAEKTVRIERKKEIDELSLKITYLRRIAYHIRAMHEFWKFRTVSIKAAVDTKYPNLSYEEFRGYDIPGIQKFSYEESTKIHDEIYGTNGQAYLALKGLEDGATSFSFYWEVNPINYSIEDVTRYEDYSSSFWYLLDTSDDTIVNFNGVNEYWLKNIDELYPKIMGRHIDKQQYKLEIKNMFTEFDSVIFKKHQYLTLLNSNVFPLSFRRSFLNMLVFVFVLIVSLILFVVNVNNSTSTIITVCLLSIFISNAIDLVFLTIKSIKDELNVNEIFKI